MKRKKRTRLSTTTPAKVRPTEVSVNFSEFYLVLFSTPDEVKAKPTAADKKKKDAVNDEKKKKDAVSDEGSSAEEQEEDTADTKKKPNHRKNDKASSISPQKKTEAMTLGQIAKIDASIADTKADLLQPLNMVKFKKINNLF